MKNWKPILPVLIMILILVLVFVWNMNQETGHYPGCAGSRLTGEITVFTGTIVDHLRVITDGAVMVHQGKIAWIGMRNNVPEKNARLIETNGYIYPGFIDSHNHPSYNFLLPWRPGRTFQNRYQWASTKEYSSHVKPRTEIQKQIAGKVAINRFAEIKAMISGAVMIQGMDKLTGIKTLVRNLDSFNLCCEDFVSTSIHPLQPREMKRAMQILLQLDRQETKRHIIHLGEGIDDRSRGELEELRKLGLLRPETVIIHGTAFQTEELRLMSDTGMGLVWSPQSNIACYGQTTRADLAVKLGVKVALAPDWSVTGKNNILEELQFAWKVSNDTMNGFFSPKDLFEMITIRPAEICGFDEFLGSIETGKEADFAIFRKVSQDPFANLLEADLSDVLLVVICGKAFYGDPGLMDVAGSGPYETIEVLDVVKAIDVIEEDVSGVPFGEWSFADIVERIRADYPDLPPLADGVGFPVQKQYGPHSVQQY
ncbi:MAG: amidohydrolase family protein [Candidatus Wallbacteria bacterium]|nr:amidohydrolase family protein [Candidatus Wallbacteria bacterium]